MAELFARHPQACNFEGNLWSAFSAKIRGSKYGPEETPRTIRLYGEQHTVIINPGECE